MRAQQESTEEEPVVTASVGYLGSPVGLALEHALPAFPSLRAALVSPPSEMGEVDEAVAALAEEVAACGADADVAKAIQTDLPVDLIENVEQVRVFHLTQSHPLTLTLATRTGSCGGGSRGGGGDCGCGGGRR